MQMERQSKQWSFTKSGFDVLSRTPLLAAAGWKRTGGVGGGISTQSPGSYFDTNFSCFA
jgi:hypothetical protein